MKKINASIVALGLMLFFSHVFGQTSITIQPGPTNGKDVAIIDNQPNASWHTYPDFIATAWTNGGVPHVLRSFIDFDLSVLPSNATILSAHLSLYCNTTSSNSQLHSSLSGSNQSELWKVTSPWIATSVTWNNQPTTDSTGKIILPQSISSTQNYLNIDVTSHMQYKFANPNMHHGFMMTLTTEQMYRSMIFASSDHPTASLRPKLVIVYDTVAPPPSGPCPGYAFLQTNICNGDSLWLQGGYQKTAGLYFDTLTSIANQDSIVVTALYVHPPYTHITQVQICKGDSLNIGGVWQKAPGLYPQTWVSIYGCDSTEYIQLTHIVLDSTVTLTGTTLTANQSGAVYQWLDCELGMSVIPGATSQSFTPAVNGSYAVMIIKDGCMTISPCVTIGNIFVPKAVMPQGILLHPNPTSGQLTVDLGRRYNRASLLVLNAGGQAVHYQHNEQVERISLTLGHLPSGTYSLVMNLDGVQASTQVVKK